MTPWKMGLNYKMGEDQQIIIINGYYLSHARVGKEESGIIVGDGGAAGHKGVLLSLDKVVQEGLAHLGCGPIVNPPCVIKGDGFVEGREAFGLVNFTRSSHWGGEVGSGSSGEFGDCMLEAKSARAFKQTTQETPQGD